MENKYQMAEKHTMEMLSAPEGGGTLTTLRDSNITGKKIPSNDHVTNKSKHKRTTGAGP